jgi:7-cyano-7-deazaguanine synthase in queuosine biosynthesis
MTSGANEVFGVAAQVEILERRPKRSRAAGQFVAVLDSDLRVDPSMLERYCFASPNKTAVDFVTVLAAVRFADRAVKRRHSLAWARKIVLVVPVFDLRLWSSSRVIDELRGCLGYLTGDIWEFEFTRRQKASKLLGPGHTPHIVRPPEGSYVGIPYSDGLDSYAQAKLLLNREPSIHLISTFTDYRGGPESWNKFCRTRNQELSSVYSIPVPFEVNEPHHAESSFRSRPFIFYSLAAYGASLVGSKRVLIPENGQGSVGGSLVLLGNEAPHRSCYPGFLIRLRRLLAQLLGEDLTFEHPALLQTKGEVLRDLARVEDVSIWGHKRSCSHDQRHATLEGRRVHCGVCGGCLLRRVSMTNADLADPTSYLFADLTASTIEQAVPDGVQVRAIDAMKDVARNSVRDMHRLAAISVSDSRLEEVALDVSDAYGTLASDALERVRNLIKMHRDEWARFLDLCGQRSWVRAVMADS